MPRCSFRSFSLFAAAFIVAMVGTPGSGGMAHAGCGDYVHVGGAAPRTEMMGNHAGSQSEVAPFDFARRSGSPACHGPSCRQNPLVPLDPAPLSVSKGFDQKACLVHDVDLPRPAAGWSLFETAHVPVDFPGLRIERPPRLGSS